MDAVFQEREICWRTRLIRLAVLAATMIAAGCVARPAWGQIGAGPMPAGGPLMIRTMDDLAELSAPQLDSLYRQGAAGPVPTGQVRGLALYPDARFARARSKAARVAWQGKVFDPATNTATNRFFGLRVVRGQVYEGQSWLDGGPAMILDYQNTSRLYGNYRDEIRQVAPGIFLGLMHDRTTNPPAFKMYFAFTDR